MMALLVTFALILLALFSGIYLIMKLFSSKSPKAPIAPIAPMAAMAPKVIFSREVQTSEASELRESKGK